MTQGPFYTTAKSQQLQAEQLLRQLGPRGLWVEHFQPQP